MISPLWTVSGSDRTHDDGASGHQAARQVSRLRSAGVCVT
jgi:hypothetical protein